MPKEIFIIGAGTYGEAMYELAEILNYTVKGFYDEDKEKFNKNVMGTRVIGSFRSLAEEEIRGKQFIVAIGNNEVRYNMMAKINMLGGITPSLIHPSAVISPSAIIGKGVYIQANVYIWTKVKIQDYSIISPHVVIAHHSTIGKACLISTLTGVGASINIKDKVFVGMGCTLVTGMETVGENSVIGAGAVVLENVESCSVYAGIPARKIRTIE